MIRIIFLLAIIIVLLALQVFLSTRKNKWIGLIIPGVLFILMTIFLLTNLNAAFYKIGDFGQFLLDHGRKGIWALSLKIGFIYFPVVLNLIVYFICRSVYKSNHPKPNKKEINKMLADDLS